MGTNDCAIPGWVQALEPVRKLPTKNGSRIRRCIYDALEKGPPTWAKNRLEYSISKAVYKANASGPTKRAVLSVLADVYSKSVLVSQHAQKETEKKHILSVPDITLKLCQIVLRRTASLVDDEACCRLFKRNLMDAPADGARRLINSRGMAFDYLDFRTIDSKLAVGAYEGSHEAFLRDVQELWHNIRIGHAEQPDLIQLVDILSQHFESLYEKEVLDNVRKLREYSESDSVSAEADCEVGNILLLTSDMPEAAWNFGLCKLCNTDKDDDSVLLCDICGGGYHTYCLKPPLGAVPEGKWYCPSCISPEHIAKAMSNVSELPEGRKCEEHYGSHQSRKLGCMVGGLEGQDGSETSEDEDFICEVCGDKGFREAIVDCYKCEDAYVHRYCFYDKSKIWVEDVLWACGDCEPFDPDEHLPEKEPPTCDQATEGEQGLTQKLKQRENRPDKQNGNKARNSTNFSPLDSPTDRTEPGQSSAIQKKKGKEKVEKTQNQAGSKK